MRNYLYIFIDIQKYILHNEYFISHNVSYYTRVQLFIHIFKLLNKFFTLPVLDFFEKSYSCFQITHTVCPENDT